MGAADRPRARVVTVSTRASAGTYDDRSGPLLAHRLDELGFAVEGPQVVADGDPVETALRDAVEADVALVVTTGGTGLSPTDRTAEVTRGVIQREVPGIAEAVRAYGRDKVPTAVLSRGLAGVAGRTLVVNLPGSTGAVRDGMEVLAPVLRHAVEQVRGLDGHPPAAAEGRPAAGVVRALVSDSPISVTEHERLVAGESTGAVVGFAGVVRRHDHGREVDLLEYVGHPSAADVLAELAAQFAARDREAVVAVSHRVGVLRVGDTALACAVATPHRAEAFRLCGQLVDEVKHRLPVWKRQVFADGTEEWVNCP